MIRMGVCYTAAGGSKFDHGYDRTSHLSLIKERPGDACLRYEIYEGPVGREPGIGP